MVKSIRLEKTATIKTHVFENFKPK